MSLQEAARDARARIVARDDRTSRELERAYRQTLRRLRRDLRALTARIEHAQAVGEPLGSSWLFRQERYRELIAGLEEEIRRFLPLVERHVRDAQHAAVQAAFHDGQQLILEALGPAPTAVSSQVSAGFMRFNPEPLVQMVGFATNGQPLGLLLAEISPLAVASVRDALAYGVAAGRNPNVTAREVARLAEVPLTRARTIARTETLRAWRESSDRVYASSGVVTGWTWWSALDARTCASCWAQHGSEHPLGEVMATHPNCRCAKVPRTLSWAQIGFPSVPDRRPTITPGPEVFAARPRSVQREVLGARKFDAYRTGRVTLDDLVARTQSARWGTGTREASLREALAA